MTELCSEPSRSSCLTWKKNHLGPQAWKPHHPPHLSQPSFPPPVPSHSAPAPLDISPSQPRHTLTPGPLHLPFLHTAMWFCSVPSSTAERQCILMVQSRDSGARWDSNLSSTTSQVALPRWYLIGSQMLLVVMNLPASAGDARDVGSIPGLGRSPGEGNGNPLQYSCLETPTDRGAWQATVHGVAESWT